MQYNTDMANFVLREGIESSTPGSSNLRSTTELPEQRNLTFY